MSKPRLLEVGEYPPRLRKLIKAANRVLEDDEVSRWLKAHCADQDSYEEFLDHLLGLTATPFYEAALAPEPCGLQTGVLGDLCMAPSLGRSCPYMRADLSCMAPREPPKQQTLEMVIC